MMCNNKRLYVCCKQYIYECVCVYIDIQFEPCCRGGLHTYADQPEKKTHLVTLTDYKFVRKKAEGMRYVLTVQSSSAKTKRQEEGSILHA